MSHLSNTIRALRERAGLTQSELAARLEVSKSTVSMYERGERSPDVPTMQKLCTVLGTDMNSLTGSPAPAGKLDGAYLALAREMQDKKIDPQDIRDLLDILGRAGGEQK